MWDFSEKIDTSLNNYTWKKKYGRSKKIYIFQNHALIDRYFFWIDNTFPVLSSGTEKWRMQFIGIAETVIHAPVIHTSLLRAWCHWNNNKKKRDVQICSLYPILASWNNLIPVAEITYWWWASFFFYDLYLCVKIIFWTRWVL